MKTNMLCLQLAQCTKRQIIYSKTVLIYSQSIFAVITNTLKGPIQSLKKLRQDQKPKSDTLRINSAWETMEFYR